MEMNAIEQGVGRMNEFDSPRAQAFLGGITPDNVPGIAMAIAALIAYVSLNGKR